MRKSSFIQIISLSLVLLLGLVWLGGAQVRGVNASSWVGTTVSLPKRLQQNWQVARQQLTAFLVAKPLQASNAVRTPMAKLRANEDEPQQLRLITASAAPGTEVVMPVEIEATGAERRFAFSLSFNPEALAKPRIQLGSEIAGAQLHLDESLRAAGKLGVEIVLPADVTLTAGKHRLASVRFALGRELGVATLPVEFADAPVARGVYDGQEGRLASGFANGVIVSTPGMEGDVTPREGQTDGEVTLGDWAQLGRFTVGLDALSEGSEFQRADCAPRETQGDGQVTVGDWVQAARYAAGLDTPAASAGPSVPMPVEMLAATANLEALAQQQERVLRVLPVTLTRSQQGTVMIELAAQGNESALGFTVNFDPAQLTFVQAAGGSDAQNANIIINNNDASKGKVTVSLMLAPGQKFAAGARKVVALSFVPPANSTANTTTITLTAAAVVDDKGANLPVSLASGLVTLTPTVTQVAALTSLNPATVLVGTTNLSLLVNGTNLAEGAVVRVNGQERPTAFISATQLRATLLSTDVEESGTVTVNVRTADGILTNNLALEVNNPAPTLTALNPSSVATNSGAQALTVTGTNFVPGAVVKFGNTNRPTTFVSSTQLTVQLPASAVVTAGTVDVSVTNPAPGGGTSNVLKFTISAPKPIPRLTSISPSTAQAGAPATTINLTGTGFVQASIVRWNGEDRPTTYVSATQLTAQISAEDLANAGSASVTVYNAPPGGGTSSAQIFTITQPPNPTAVLTALSPNRVTAGSEAFTLTITGTGFVKNSVVRVGNQDRVTTYVSPTEIRAVILASDIANGGSLALRVFNPAPGGGTSNELSLPISFAAPTILSVSPASIVAGGPAFTLSVFGTNFAPGSMLRWNGENRVTTVVSATELTAQITAADIANVGSAKLTVFSPAVGTQGASSNEVSFAINQAARPLPRVTALSPSSVQAGSDAFTLTVTGTSFVNDSVIYWNGQPRPTTFVNSTQLTAQISANDIATPSKALVSVFTPAPGGGESNKLEFNVTQPPNPTPAIGSLNPTSFAVGTNGGTLTVNGSNFVSGSVVRFNGQTRPTSFVSATQLTAQLTAADLAEAGTAAITVLNPTPGGGTSAALTLNISNPTPTITGLNPNPIAEGGPAQTLTINGTNFVRGAQVLVNGVARVTTFVSATQLTVQLTAAELATNGSLNLQVNNPAPGGGVSNVVALEVRKRNPLPRLLSINPQTIAAGSNGFAMIVNGSNFVPGAVVRWNGQERRTEFSSETLLVAQILPEDVAAGGNYQVTVMNPGPGGGSSSALTFQVTNPVPRLVSFTPDALVAGSGAATLTITGVNFSANSIVRLNGVDLPTTFVSATQLTAQVPANAVASGGTFALTVFNPPPGGGTTSAINLVISNPVPVATSLLPGKAAAGGPGFNFTVTGSNFVPGTTVRWNGQERPTTVLSPTQLLVTVTAADVAQVGTAQVIVVNPAPGGGTSVPLSFTLTNEANPVPALSVLDPNRVFVGTQAFTLRVTGSGFVVNSRVLFNGAERATSYINETTLLAQVSAADVATAGTANVTVVNPLPGGGTSNGLPLAILQQPAPVPTITVANPVTMLAGGNAQVLSITGTGFTPNSVVRWNGTNRPTTFVSATQLTAQLSAADVAAEGNYSVIVFNEPTTGGGGGVSNEATVRILATPSAQMTFNPARPTTDDTVIVTLSGTWPNGCVPMNPQVTVAGNEIRVSTSNPGQICTQVVTPWTLSATLGKLPGPAGYLVRAIHTTPQGQYELVRGNLVILPGKPVITSVSPTVLEAGTVAPLLVINGNGFTAGSLVNVNGSSRATALTGTGQLTAQLLDADIATVRTLRITVVSPPVDGAGGGGTSNDLQISVVHPRPTITNLEPNRVSVGVSAFSLTVTGTGFVPSSVVRWNGSDRTTVYLGPTSLLATIRTEDVATQGTGQVTVFNPAPGGGLSQMVPLNVDTLVTCQSVCFQSARYYLLGNNRLPTGSVIILGVNNNVPLSIQTNQAEVRRVLQGGNAPFQQLNAEYVAAQLSIATAGTFNTLAVMNGSLRCYGVVLAPVQLSNGFVIANTVTIGQIFSQVRLAAIEGREADMLVLSDLLRMINGDDANGRCGGNLASAPLGPIDIPSFMQKLSK